MLSLSIANDMPERRRYAYSYFLSETSSVREIDVIVWLATCLILCGRHSPPLECILAKATEDPKPLGTSSEARRSPGRHPSRLEASSGA